MNTVLKVNQKTIGETLRLAKSMHQHKSAYIDNGRSYSFNDVDGSVDQIATGLLKLGLSRGDRIGMVGLNQIEWVQLFYAATRIGVAVVAMSVRHRASEFRQMLGESGAKAIVTIRRHDDFDFCDLLCELRSELPQLQTVIVLGESGDDNIEWSTLASTPVDIALLDRAQSAVLADDLAMVIYTSGTTGRPKGAALTHKTMLAAASAQATHIKASAEDLVQLAMPLNHVGGITCGVLTMLLGGGVVELVPAFKAETVLLMMEQNPPTIVIGVPTMLTLLLMSIERHPLHLDSIRLVITGGSNADATLLTKLQATLRSATVMNLYGLSEASGALVMTPWDASKSELIESIGRPLPGAEMRVVNGLGEDVGQDAVGELIFKGLGVVANYIDGAVNDASFTPDGWLHSGDLAYIDGRGLVHLKGRQKEMYIQGGFNVYPVEVEAFISQHPKVLMVAGVGVPDPVLGEVGRYFVVPRPGSELSVDEIRDFCAASLADYKIPRQIFIRDSLPMSPAGKLLKSSLRDEGKT